MVASNMMILWQNQNKNLQQLRDGQHMFKFLKQQNHQNTQKQMMQKLQTNQISEEELAIIQEELQALKIQEYNQDQGRQTGFNVYADRQLEHLVVMEEFDWKKIVSLLKVVFVHDRIDVSEENCRERWWQIHQSRKNGSSTSEKIMEEKRLKSIMAFSNPYSLYDVDQLIKNLEKNEKATAEDQEQTKALETPKGSGYNIFTHNFRQIDNWEDYNNRKEMMQKALVEAQKESHTQKALIFSPDYDQLEKGFSVHGEELTGEKASKLLAYQIQIEKVERELVTKNRQMGDESKYEEQIKRRVDRQKRTNEEKYELEDNWDEYESD